MKRCVYLKKRPTGGIGNRLFTYNFLYQLAHQLDFVTDIHQDDSSLIANSKSRIHSKYQHFSHQYLQGIDVPSSNTDFQLMLNELSNSKGCLQVSNTFLGDTFFQSCVVHPRTFFSSLYPESKSNTDPIFQIGMHFRGTDFKTWNPNSILNPNYYLDSFEHLFNVYGNQNLELKIFTDDLDLDSVGIVIEKLHKEIPIQVSSDANPISDLKSLSGCNAIVSSPSTFAIWSGILSGDALIIHSRDWVEDRVKNDDSFWVQVAQGGGAFYKVGAIL